MYCIIIYSVFQVNSLKKYLKYIIEIIIIYIKQFVVWKKNLLLKLCKKYVTIII